MTTLERLAFANRECFKTYLQQKFSATVMSLESQHDDRTIFLKICIGTFALREYETHIGIAKAISSDLQRMFSTAIELKIEIFESKTFVFPATKL